jgi:TatA/E family protein of Tat protein translocase
MNLFNIGPGEMLIILVFALIIFGPGKLPEVAKGLGKAIGDFRRASQGLTDDLTRELNAPAADAQGRSEPAPAQTTSQAEARTTVSAPATAPSAGGVQQTSSTQAESKPASAAVEPPPADSATTQE